MQDLTVCACCALPTREEQLIDSEDGQVCLRCDSESVLAALDLVDFDCLVSEQVAL